MKRTLLGNSELEVSEIGFGCMSLGQDERSDLLILEKAFDEGINFFDTADLYQMGRNEELIGKAFRSKRSQVILATKVGNRWNADGSGWYWDPSKSYIKEAAYKSLKRLQTDYIDLYQLHGGTILDPIDETIEAFEELKQEGVIRYYGISSIRPNVIREYLKHSKIVSVMMQYSILDRRPEEEILDLLHANRVSVIGRGPLAKGLLSDRKQPIVDGYLNYTKDEIVQVVSALYQLCDPNGSLTELALRYPLQHPAVGTIIPGASKIEQLLQNVQAGDIPSLDSNVYKRIQALSKADRYQEHR